MKTATKTNTFILVLMMVTSTSTMAQTNPPAKAGNESEMKIFVIEREIPGAGNFTPADLKSISQKSCGVLKDLGPNIKWLHSYVTGNKIYCIYEAKNEELVKQHAKLGGFPANSITQVSTVISPKTAD